MDNLAELTRAGGCMCNDQSGQTEKHLLAMIRRDTAFQEILNAKSPGKLAMEEIERAGADSARGFNSIAAEAKAAQDTLTAQLADLSSIIDELHSAAGLEIQQTLEGVL